MVFPCYSLELLAPIKRVKIASESLSKITCEISIVALFIPTAQAVISQDVSKSLSKYEIQLERWHVPGLWSPAGRLRWVLRRLKLPQLSQSPNLYGRVNHPKRNAFISSSQDTYRNWHRSNEIFEIVSTYLPMTLACSDSLKVSWPSQIYEWYLTK